MKAFIYLLFILFPIFAYSHLTIGIFTYKVRGMKPWDPASVQEGIAGSEEAVIYISEKLAKLGHKVIVWGDPPRNSPYSNPEANPRFVSLDFTYPELLDIAVAWRMPYSAEQLKSRAQRIYLWPHDTLAYTPTVEQANGFTDVLWLSEWQREQWGSIQPAFLQFTKVFGNGINPEQFHSIEERENPYSCIYGSNYARGLDLLLEIWPMIKREFPKATLDIYYGWEHWGLLSPEKESEMRQRLLQLTSLGVKEWGQVGHEALNRAYEKSSFWVYPCTAPETFCITALRAQLAGAIPVVLEGSALKETVAHGFKCTERDNYYTTLVGALRYAEKISIEDRKKMGSVILEKFTWQLQAEAWNRLFDTALPEASHLQIPNYSEHNSAHSQASLPSLVGSS